MRGALLIAAALGAVALVGLGLRTDAPWAVSRRPAIEITGTWWTPGPMRHGMRSVTGKVRNNTDTPFGTVTIELLLMNAAGDSVGTHVETLRDLEPHAIRQFSTWMLPEHPARYRVRSVRGS